MTTTNQSNTEYKILLKILKFWNFGKIIRGGKTPFSNILYIFKHQQLCQNKPTGVWTVM